MVPESKSTFDQTLKSLEKTLQQIYNLFIYYRVTKEKMKIAYPHHKETMVLCLVGEFWLNNKIK